MARTVLAWLLFASVATSAWAQNNSNFPGCADPPASGSLVITFDSVSCQLIDSQFVGAPTPFSYFVPGACAGKQCPVLYLLHGFGGSYQSLLQDPSRLFYAKALASGPPVDPNKTLTPWTYADPSTWVPQQPLDMILVAPHGRTVPGGRGPGADLDGFWADWNPKYQDTYGTQPPRFESYLIHELIPFVETHFPAGRGRAWRALDGESLGGYGSYKNGLQHPDEFASIGSISGAHNFLFAPGLDPLPVSAGISPPIGLGYFPARGLEQEVPFSTLPDPLKGFLVALLILGDPVADQAYFRGNMPRDLAMNGRAWTAVGDNKVQTLHIRGMVNDAVPRRVEDFTNVGDYPTAQGFEDIVLPMNLEMETAFADEGVLQDFEIHPGLHSRPYRNPYLRRQLEEHYRWLQHDDGKGTPLGPPDVFDYRSIRTDFTIWGWQFHVDRQPVEFLNLSDVSCSGFTLRGTGKVTVTVPAGCGTGLDGSSTFTVDLGPPFPTDEPAGAGASPIYGRTATVPLS